jgi:O-antigen ligase/Tfp pilus assembly protein PilF
MVLEKRKPLLAYIISTFYLLLVAVTYTSLNPTLLKIGIWSSALGFGAWLYYLYKSKKPLRYPRLLLPIAGYMLLRFITTTQAPFPIISFEVALRELILLFGFLFVFNSLDLFWKTRTWEDTLINFALVFCFIELGLAFFWHRIWVDITGSLFPLPPVGYRAPGVFLGHPNILAGFLNLVAPIMVVRMVREKSWKKRVLWGLGLAIFVPTLYFTSSRTGLLAGIIGVATTLFLLYVPNLYKKFRDRQTKSFWDIVPRRVFFVALIAVVAVSGFVIFFLIQSQRISTHAPTIISARSGIWGPAIEVIKTAPILGHGPGSFSVFFAQETQIPPGFATSHAHNVLLQIAAETGLFGLVLMVLIIVAVTISFVRTWRTASSDVKHRLAAYAGAGIAMLSHHSLDYLFESPLYALSVFILFALTLREMPILEAESFRKAHWIFMPVTILFVFLIGSTYTLVGATEYWVGVNAGRNGDWNTATEKICSAYKDRPEITLYGFQCGLAYAQLYFRNGDLTHLQNSLAIHLEAIENDPYWPIHWANLAMLEWENGDYDSALIKMQNALERAPPNNTIARNLAWMESLRNNDEAAINALAQALTYNPWLQLDITLENSATASEAIERFKLKENETTSHYYAIQGWQALLSNQLDTATSKFRQSIRTNPAEGLAYAGIGYTLQQFGQIDDANFNIQFATFLKSSSPLVLQAAATVAQQQGLEIEARNHIQSAFDQIDGLSYSSSYYFRTYLRYFLQSDLVPQMKRGGLTSQIVESLQALTDYYIETGKPNNAKDIQNRIAVEMRGVDE